MSNFVEIGKLEAARRHLEAGIELFFEKKDPLVVYTTAWAAYQVLSELCKVRGIKRQMEDSELLKEMGVHGEVITAFRKPRNFMQHADRDPEGVVKFFPDSSYIMLLLAIELYQSLAPGDFIPGRVMKMWFFVKYPEYAPTEVAAQIKSLPHRPSADDYELFSEMLQSVANNSLKADHPDGRRP